MTSEIDDHDEFEPAMRSRDTERRRATVLSADITGFTSLVERAGDEEGYEIISTCLWLLETTSRVR